MLPADKKTTLTFVTAFLAGLMMCMTLVQKVEAQVCDRTNPFPTLLTAAASKGSCENVTTNDLNSITTAQDWSNQSITSITTDDLADLINLDNINLANNGITTLLNDTFAETIPYTLNLSNNDISVIQGDALDYQGLPPTYLNWDFSHNAITSDTLATRFLVGNSKADGLATSEFNLSHNSISHIEVNYLTFINVEVLDLSYNDITNFESNTFHGVYDTTDGLSTANVTLYLNNNNITKLKSNSFNGGAWEQIYLNHNQISALGISSFNDVGELKLLDLSHNLISDFNANAINLGDLLGSTLELLDLSYNPLLLKENNFAGIHLVNLYLEHNNLTVIPRDTFANADSYRNIYLSNNNITTLQADAFSFAPGLEHLYLNNNALNTIPDGVFGPISSLITVDLGENNLSSVAENAFSQLSNLQTLGLDNNAFNSVPVNIFSSNNTLTDLRLQHNNISVIPDAAFTDYSQLNTLTLSNNALTNISANAFQGLAATTINLDANSITELPVNLLLGHTNPSNITNFDLSNNPLQDNTWEVTNAHWEINADGSISLTIDHAIPTAISLDLSSNTGTLNPSSILIPAGSTSSQAVNWVSNQVGQGIDIVTDNISAPVLNGYILVPQLSISGVCNRTIPFPTLLTAAANKTDCDFVSIADLNNIITAQDWSSQNINNITDNDLADLSSLTNIDFANNNINQLVNGTFQEVPAHTLDFSNNNISVIEPDALDYYGTPPDELDWNFSNNAITSNTLASSFLVGNSKSNGLATNKFNLSFNNITTIQQTYFDGINIKTLDLSHNQITNFSADTFDTIYQPAAGAEVDIQLNHNNITALAANSFSSDAWQVIVLHDNQISSLQNNTFVNTKNLQGLDLSFNQIVDFNASSVNQNASDAYPMIFNLGSNPLVFKPNNFAGLTIRELYLFALPTSTIANNTFAGINSLDRIRLDFSNISILETNAFANTGSLTRVHLPNNKLKVIPADAFGSGSLIDRLYLQNNQIATIGNSAFAQLTELNLLDLSGNNLISLSDASFDGLAATDIDLSDSNIATLPLNLLSTHTQPSNITNFDISGNNLTNNTWEITNASWQENINGSVTLHLGHSLTTAINVTISSVNGTLSHSNLIIPAGSTSSQSVAWTQTLVGAIPNIQITEDQINDPVLNGFITLPDYTFTGVCNRTIPFPTLLTTAVGKTDCSLVTYLDLGSVSAAQNWSSQNINNITENDLAGLFKLNVINFGQDTLNFSNNNISKLVNGTFADVQVHTINFSGNNISVIEPTAMVYFGNAPFILDWNFSFNAITSATFASKFIVKSVKPSEFSVNLFNFSFNDITTIQQAYFDGINVNTLDLSHNQITNFSADTFDTSYHPTASGAVELDLNNNNLTALAENSFSSAAWQTIRLFNNQINSLSNNTFANTNKLQRLNLSGNQITDFNSSSVDQGNNPTAMNFFLDANPIILKTSNFAGMTIRNLYLRDLPTSTIASHTFAGINSLDTIYMSNGSISILATDAFTNAAGLNDLYLDNNSLTNIPSDAFGSGSSLTNLYLQDNQIATIGNSAFAQLTELNLLDLSGNDLTGLSDASFDGLAATNIDLSDNNITTLPLNLLINHTQPASITSFDISGNNLTNNSWEITNASWQENIDGSFTLQLGHSLPVDINLDLTSATGTISPNSITIASGSTSSQAVTWTAFNSGGLTNFVVDLNQINVTQLSGYINIPDVVDNGVCDRTIPFPTLLTTAVGKTDCKLVSGLDLESITAAQDWSSQNINDITDADLAGLLNVAAFDLSSNTLTVLADNILLTTTISAISLASNNISVIQTNALVTSTSPDNNVDYNLSNNAITSTTLSSGFLTALKSIDFPNKSIDLSYNNITTLDNSQLDIRSDNLNLSNNQITNLPATVFINTRQSGHDMVIDLSYNQLTSIAAETFFGETVAQVDLSYNQIDTLATDAVRYGEDLTSLDLGYNLISDFNASSIDQNPNDLNVQLDLVLDGNPLVLKANNFAGLELDDLYLRELPTSTIASNTFASINSLDTIYMSNGNISILATDAFTNAAGLNDLYLDNNSLTNIPSDAFGSGSSLNNLYLQDNQIATIGNRAFAQLTELNLLDLSGNDLTGLSDASFDGLAATNIDLSDSNIATLPLNLLVNHTQPASITSFDISGNNLTNNTWEITNSYWQENINGSFTLHLGHSLPVDINLNLTSATGTISPSTISIASGSTSSQAVTWTAINSGDLASFAVNLDQINVTLLSGYINIPDYIYNGVCDRTIPFPTLLTTAVGKTDCNLVTFLDLGSLTAAQDWSSQSINAITDNDLAGLLNVAAFDLSTNALTTLGNSTFAQTNPSSISLANNNITDLQPNTFVGTNWTSINLAGNQIDSLQPNAFNGVEALSTLNLGDNNLVDFNATAVVQGDNPTKINNFNLNGNPLVLKANNFANMRIGTLYLRNTGITTVPTDAFSGTRNLDYIRFEGGVVTSLEANAFNNIPSFDVLFMRDHLLETIPSDAFGSGTSLDKLFMERNQLSSIGTDAFIKLTTLDELWFTDNQFTVIPNNMGALTATRLILSGNQITAIAADSFDGIPNLNRLLLNDNQITSIAAGAFSSVPNLGVLSLLNNDLVELQPETFANLSATDIDLRNNQLTTLPVNLLINHTAPQSITNFAISGNALVNDSWEITNVSWIEHSNGSFTLQLGHSLPVDINLNLTATIGTISPSTITIASGSTSSQAVTWTAINSDDLANFAANLDQINVTQLSGYINIPDFSDGGVCDRTIPFPTLLTTAVGKSHCSLVSNFDLGSVSAAQDWSNQSINAITDADLAGLLKVAAFDLSSNGLTVLADDILLLTNPSSISLAHNNISVIEQDALLTSTSPDNNADYNLSNNAITSTTLSSGFLNSLRDPSYPFKVIDLSYNNITTLERTSLAVFTTNLNLSHNQIGDFVFDALYDLRVISIDMVLDLSYNQLTNIAARSFFGESVGQVDLSHNQIDTLAPETVFSGVDLSSLDLGYNQISDFNASSIHQTNNPKVQLDLVLDGNPLGLKANNFAGLVLADLYLRELSTSTIPSLTFAGINSLDTIYMNNGNISILATDAFTNTTELANLYLVNNSLTNIPGDAFGSGSSLNNLYLQDNQIATIANSAFAQLTELNLLDLSGNNLTNLSIASFDGLAATNINVSANSIATIPLNLLANHSQPSNITSFDITSNNITNDTWEITNANWVELDNNNFVIQLDHAVPQQITLGISSATGTLNTNEIIILQGATTSNTVRWTPSYDVATLHLLPSILSINISALSGYLQFDEIGNGMVGICNRTPEIRTLLLDILNQTDCTLVTTSDLLAISGPLDWSDELIPNLLAYDLDYLTNITNFDLSANYFAQLETNAFNLTNPESINLANNNLSIIASNALFTNVIGDIDIDVNLSHNQISSETLASGFLIDDGTNKFVNGSFDLSHNLINHIEPTVFSGFNPHQLWLNDNNISTINDNAFSSSTELTSLHLQNNALTALTAPIFTNLASVVTLDLANNSISTLSPQTFSQLPALITLNLTANHLSTVSSAEFENLFALNIDITHNNLTALPINLLQNHNDPSSIEQFVFTGNSVANDTWEITDANWEQSANNTFTFNLDHSLPIDISFTVTSATGTLDSNEITILKGSTKSSAIQWIALVGGIHHHLQPSVEQINIPQLNGYIHIDELGSYNGICDRSDHIQVLLKAAVGKTDCSTVLVTDLLAINNTLNWNNLSFASLIDIDLDYLANIETFDLSSNNLELLVDNLFNLTDPAAIDLANNNISVIQRQALFSLHNATNGHNINLSNNAITAETLNSGFLTADNEKGFVNGTFDLSHNQIDAIDKIKFDGFNPNILYLNHNQITTLGNNTFDDATALTQLYLQHNQISDLPVGTFVHTSALQNLDLSHNNINTLQPVDFVSLTASDINLSHNSLTSLPINLLGFHTNPSAIISFDIANNSIPNDNWQVTNVSWIPEIGNNNSFTVQIGHALPQNTNIAIASNTGSLNETFVSISKGQTLSNAFTWTPKYPSIKPHLKSTVSTIEVPLLSGHILIEELGIPNIGICDRTAIILDLLLEKLNQTDCQIITSQQLAAISGTLNWADSSIDNLSSIDLSNLTSVAAFDLTNNSITALPDGLFNHTSPDSISLGHNNIAQIHPNALLTSLTGEDDVNLNLTANAITTATLSNGFLAGNNGKQFVNGSVDLSQNQITAINQLMFNDFNPAQLYLQHNALTDIGTNTFLSLQNLAVLNLHNNSLATIDSNTFQHLANITSIDASNNLLTSLDQQLFGNLTTLQTLDLSGNNISSIHSTAFANLSATNIDLSDNNLTELPLNMLLHHSDPGNIASFNLSANPLVNNTWVVTNATWIKVTGTTYQLRIDHPVPEDIVIDLNSSTGSLSSNTATIVKGSTSSNSIEWTAFFVTNNFYINPIETSVAVPTLNGHINLESAGSEAGICHRSEKIIALLLAEVNLDDCKNVTVPHLLAINYNLDWFNQSIPFLLDGDLNTLTNVAQFDLSNNLLTSLANDTLAGINPDEVSFANNNISTIDRKALFTNVLEADDININLSFNNISSATLDSGFLTANGNQKFTDGIFDLSNNNISQLQETMLQDFNPQVLYLNHNNISSIGANSFDSAVSLTELYLQHNQISKLPIGAFLDNNALQLLDLSHNNFTTLSAVDFIDVTATAINISDNDLVVLPINLLLYHSDPASITSFDIDNNPFSASQWEITNLSWIEDDLINNSYTLQAGHVLPIDISVNISSSTGSLNTSTITIPKGQTVSNAFTWTQSIDGLQIHIQPETTQIFVPALDGYVNIYGIGITETGICYRTNIIRNLILAALNTTDCLSVTQQQLEALTGDLIWNETAISLIAQGDLDYLTGINQFDMSANSITALINDTFLLTQPAALNLSNNNISAIAKQALLTNNVGSNDININLSHNAINTTTLNSGFLSSSNGKTFNNGIFDFSHNQITSLQQSMFTDFNPAELYLNNNQIATIAADVLSSATNLAILHLHNNQITNLTATSFTNLTNVTMLDLSNNNISNLTANVFSPLTNLQHIKLNNNSIANIVPAAFNNLNANQIDLRNNNLTDLPLNLFKQHNDPSSITSVLLTNNLIVNETWQVTDVSWEEIEENRFILRIEHSLPNDIYINLTSATGSLNTSTVTILKGSTNSSAVSWTALVGGTDAQITPLNHQIDIPNFSGHIVIPSYGSYNGICNRTEAIRDLLLTQVNKTDCKLVTIPDLTAINSDLQWNAQNIVNITQDDLLYLNNVQHFDLAFNALQHLVNQSFADTSALSLALGNNNISTIERTALFNNALGTSAIDINLSFNAIDTDTFNIAFLAEHNGSKFVNGTFDFSNNYIDLITTGMFNDFDPKKLSLNNNIIQAIQADAFNLSDSLVELDLQNNLLTELSANIFNGIANVAQINLSNNQINQIQSGLFNNVTALAQLNLSHNALTSLPLGIFANLSAEVIDLSFNNITQIARNVLKDHTNPASITEFNVQNNSLLNGTWEITNASWSLDENNIFTLNIEHTLPSDLTLGISSKTGTFEVSSVTIPAGNTASNPAQWTANFDGLTAHIQPASEQVDIPELSGYINIPAIGFSEIGICDRSTAIQALLLASLNASQCNTITAAQLQDINGSLAGQNQNIAELFAHDLKNLSSIETFDLSDNQINTLADSMFDQTNPTAINFANNNISDIQTNSLFNGNAGVNINLSNNAITVATLHNGFLVGSAQRSFSGGSFDLSHNQIDFINSSMLSQFNPAVLLLNYNNIASIADNSFSDATGLTQLSINNNQLTTLSPGIFNNLSLLTTLDLSNNAISTIGHNTFEILPNLINLDLSNNALSTLEAEMFNNLNATVIDLSNNNLATLPMHLLINHTDPSSIVLLNLSSNTLPSDSWAITNISWLAQGNNQFALHIGHTLPNDITVGISSNTGVLTANTVTIPKGSLQSDNIGWTTNHPGLSPHIEPALSTINITALNGHLNLVEFGDASIGICDRTAAIQTKLLELLNTSRCSTVTENELQSINDAVLLNTQNLTSIKAYDLDHLLSVPEFDFADNALNMLVNGTMNLTLPTAVSFANNNISVIQRNALFTNHDGDYDVNINLSQNAITSQTLQTGFLVGIDNKQFVNGTFDLSHNQITLIDQTMFTTFNPKVLHLNNNFINLLGNNTFSSANNLQTLHLQHNEITDLPVGTFVAMPSLQTLNLQHNHLQTLKEVDFFSLTATEINLSNNNITFLPVDLLKLHNDPSSIVALDLSNNPLFNESWLITQAKWLEDQDNSGSFVLQLEHALPQNITVNITSLTGSLNDTTIFIAKGETQSQSIHWTPYIADIDTEITPDLSTLDIPALDGHISIAAIGKYVGICDRTPQVQQVILEIVGKTDCANVSIADLISIADKLNLSSLQINHIAPNDLKYLSNIDRFDVSGNTIQTLSSSTFADTAAISISLANNNLSVIAQNALFTSTLGDIDIDINLSYNNINDTSFDNAFLSASSDKQFKGGTFDFSYNSIQNLTQQMFGNFNPAVLMLHNIQLNSIADFAFSAAPDMQALHLQNNNLTYIPTQSFNNLDALQYLDLSNNSLADIEQSIFTPLNSLTTLNLSNNNLTTITNATFANLTATDIDLSNNNITTIAIDSLKDHANPGDITSFNIAGNPITSWEITKIRIEQITNTTYQIVLQHALPENIVINLASATGTLSQQITTIGKGQTSSNIITWTANNATSQPVITPVNQVIQIPLLSGFVSIENFLEVPEFENPIDTITLVTDHNFDPIELPNAVGGDGGLTYSLTEVNTNTLTNGLSFDASQRLLSGPASSIGTYNLLYEVIDGDGDAAQTPVTVEVIANIKPLFEDNSNLSYRYIQDESINIILPSASEANAELIYSLNPSGALPSGVFFDAEKRQIIGSSDAINTYVFEYRATDSLDGDFVAINITLDIELQVAPKFIDSELFTNATERQDDSNITLGIPNITGGNGALSYSFTTDNASGLPAGLIYNTSTRAINGQSDGFGSFTVSVTVTDAYGQFDSFTFVLNVLESLGFADDIPTHYSVLLNHDTEIQLPIGKGGVPQYTLNLIGDLPLGISFDSATRTISGNTPIEYGVYPLTYQIVDTQGYIFNSNTTLLVTPNKPQFLAFVDDLRFNIGDSVNITLPAVNTDHETNITYIANQLPFGIDFDNNTRILSGSIQVLGTHQISYRAVDIANQSVAQTFKITVKAEPILTQDIMWRQALHIADHTVTSAQQRFKLINEKRLPYEKGNNYEGANFQITPTNWIGAWMKYASTKASSNTDNYAWQSNVESSQVGVDYSGKNYLFGVAVETISTHADYQVKADAFDYTGELNIYGMRALSLYGGVFNSNFNLWAASSTGEGTATVSVLANDVYSVAYSDVDYAMTALGGSFEISNVFSFGYEGIIETSLDFTDSVITDITENSASRDKYFGTINFGKWTNRKRSVTTRAVMPDGSPATPAFIRKNRPFSWTPIFTFAVRSDSSQGEVLASGAETSLAVDLKYRSIHIEIGQRNFKSDAFSETGQWLTINLLETSPSGLSVELTQRLGDTGSVSNTIFAREELTDILENLNHNTEIVSSAVISYGWALNSGTLRLSSQGNARSDLQQSTFGDISALLSSEAGLTWNNLELSFNDAASRYTWKSTVSGSVMDDLSGLLKPQPSFKPNNPTVIEFKFTLNF